MNVNPWCLLSTTLTAIISLLPISAHLNQSEAEGEISIRLVLRVRGSDFKTLIIILICDVSLTSDQTGVLLKWTKLDT